MCYRGSGGGFTEIGTARGAASILASPGVARFHVGVGEARGRVGVGGLAPCRSAAPAVPSLRPSPNPQRSVTALWGRAALPMDPG